MKAVKITEPGKVKIVEIEKPDMGIEDILLKVKYVGFCGSDLNTFRGKNPMVSYPRIPGHEIAAVIEDTGKEVPDKFKIGQKVTVVPYTNCGKCSSCKRERYNTCKFNQTLGVQRDGAMCEYIAVPWAKVITAEKLDLEKLVMVEPLTVGFHAIDRGEVTNKDTVMVLGCGMIGIGAIICAVVRGAKVIAVDIDKNKLSMVKKLGAAYTINFLEENLHMRIEKITSCLGPDVIIEAVGNTQTYLSAIDEISFAGRVVYIGYVKENVSFETKLFVQKEIDIRGSRNANPEDFQAVVNYLENISFDIKDLISERINMDQVFSTINKWSKNPGEILKIILEF